MPIICDAHVHFYSCFSLQESLAVAEQNFSRLLRNAGPTNSSVTKVLCLTERHDCFYFNQLAAGELNLNCSQLKVEQLPDPNALLLDRAGASPMLLIAGRQIVTRERVELLSLCSKGLVPDGLSLNETIKQIQSNAAIPVINWAPGKWLFQRGALVRELIAQAVPETLALGDTTLRPSLFPEPLLMKKARQRGFTVICGSDPLPFAGEEKRLGTYALYCEADIDVQDPSRWLRNSLLQSHAPWKVIGQRNTPWELLQRLQRHRHQGKKHREGGEA